MGRVGRTRDDGRRVGMEVEVEVEAEAEAEAEAETDGEGRWQVARERRDPDTSAEARWSSKEEEEGGGGADRAKATPSWTGRSLAVWDAASAGRRRRLMEEQEGRATR